MAIFILHRSHSSQTQSRCTFGRHRTADKQSRPSHRNDNLNKTVIELKTAPGSKFYADCAKFCEEGRETSNLQRYYFLQVVSSFTGAATKHVTEDRIAKSEKFIAEVFLVQHPRRCTLCVYVCFGH